MKETIRCEFPVDADAYWADLYFNEEFVRALHLEGLGCEELEVIAWEGDLEQGIKRVFRSMPKLEAPVAVKKALGESVSYTEEGTFDPKSGRYSFEVIPSALPNKIRITGDYWLESLWEGRVERGCELEFEVKVFGIGKVIEQFIARSFVDNQRKADAYTLRWLESR